MTTEEYSVKNIVIKTPSGEFASPFVSPATEDRLGTIKPDGETVTVAEDGTLSANIDIDLANLINVTYSELVELKATSKLQEGAFYRITDYITTTNGNSADTSEPSRSAGHQFDIIIQALGSSNLSDIGTCALHEDDTYFANCNLGAWQVWYDIENNASKYAWAVTDGSGKGVIYRMIDEHNNDLPYDFKNIQFFRDKTLEKYSFLVNSMKSSDGYYYTVHNCVGGNNSDMSISNDGKMEHNSIGAYTSSNGVKTLNNTISIQNTSNNKNILFYNNRLGTNCYNNTLSHYVKNNNIGSDFYNNLLDYIFFDNTIDGDFYNNKIGDNFYSNTISSFFYDNTIGPSFISNNVKSYFYNNNIKSTANTPMSYNNIDGFFDGNRITGAISNSIIGSFFEDNTLNIPNGISRGYIGSYFVGNTITLSYIQYCNIGNNFKGNTINASSGYLYASNFGNYTQNNIFNNSVYASNFGSRVINNNFKGMVTAVTVGSFFTDSTVEALGYSTIGSGVRFCAFGSSWNNISVQDGVKGASATNKLSLTDLPSSYFKLQMTVSGQVLATWEDDGIITGKKKSSVTATTWEDIAPKITTTDWDE